VFFLNLKDGGILLSADRLLWVRWDHLTTGGPSILDHISVGRSLLRLPVTLIAIGRGLPLATLFWGLAMLDLINVGNSCEPAQKAAYELFYKQSTVKLSPIRASVRQTPVTGVQRFPDLFQNQ
jgi:hypothetical protein